MSYRVTKRQREIMAAMRAAKERKRLMGEPVERPPELPDLRRASSSLTMIMARQPTRS